jgi:zinc protease
VKKFFLSSLLIFSVVSNITFAQSSGRNQAAPLASQTSAAASAAKTQQGLEVPFVTRTLPNGLEVIVLPDASIPLVTVELDVRNGSFTEPPEYHGLSHLFEHMFFKPNQAVMLSRCETTTNRFSSSYASECTAPLKLKPQIGDISYLKDAGQLNFFNGSTREEVVNYYYHVTSQYMPTAIKFINDSVRFPTFDEAEFAAEKKVVIGEIDRQESNPYSYLDLAMKQKLFYKNPTRKDPKGTRESIAAATTEKMRTIQARYYVPNNSALIVTGDVKPEEVFQVAEQIMGSWERRKVEPFTEFPLVEHPPLPKSEGLVIEKKIEGGEDQGQNVVLNIGWHGPSVGKDDAGTYAADVFSYIISQPNSRFQRNLVDSGLAASVNFGYYTQRNVGPISMVVVTTPDKAKAALKAVYGEIAQFTQPSYFTDEELESAKTILQSTDLFEREKLSEYAHTLGFWWSSTGIEYFRGYQRNLRAVTRADINRYNQTYVQDKNHIGLALMAPGVKAQANLTEADLIGGNK